MMKWILLIFLFCLLNIPFSIGKNRYPTSTTSFFSITTLADNGPGSLRQAIIDANNRLGEDTINFSPVLSGTILLNSSLPIITDALTLNGPGASLLCISGNSTYRIFEVSLSSSLFSVTLNKLTLSKGNANAGGALKNSGSGIMYLNDCILSENISPRSGAGDGGALANSISAQLNINNCTFINNESYTFGGAIYNLGKLNISNSTFTGNKSFKGAGIFSILSSGKVTLSNSTISGNISAGGPGCGIFADLDTKIEIINSTITNNIATGNGGGICILQANVILNSSIIAGNIASVRGPDIYGYVTSLGNNLIGDTTGFRGIVNGVNNDIAGNSISPLNPLLGPLLNNGGITLTHALLPGSSAIDAGKCNNLYTDQRGITRPLNGICDIGSYEYGQSISLSFGKFICFVGANRPSDNGKKSDLRAELILNNKLIGSGELLNQQIAGHTNNNGIKFIIPIDTANIIANVGDLLQLKIYARQANKQSAGLKLWYNVDSLSANSKGYSRINYKANNNPDAFLNLSDSFKLTSNPGSTATSSLLITDSTYKSFGTWSTTIQAPANRTARPAPPIQKIMLPVELKVFPNPARQYINVSFLTITGNDATVEIIGIDGKKIIVKKIHAFNGKQQLTIPTSNLVAGNYECRVIVSKGKKILAAETSIFQVIK